jgi:hypothetical protein
MGNMTSKCWQRKSHPKPMEQKKRRNGDQLEHSMAGNGKALQRGT